MAMSSRLSKLESILGSGLLAPEQRPCKACNDGTKWVPVIKMPRNEQEEKEPVERLCPGCGRNMAHVIVFFRAGPGSKYFDDEPGKPPPGQAC